MSREKLLKNIDGKARDNVVYWMTRDQRVHENHSLNHAIELAKNNSSELKVIFCLNPSFLGAGLRQYTFMIEGLKEVEADLIALNIPFVLLEGSPEIEVPKYFSANSVSDIVIDQSPLRIARNWHKMLIDNVESNIHMVDAHNVIPVWITSPKQEFAARTIRPKIHRVLADYLQPFGKINKLDQKVTSPKIDWNSLYKKLDVDKEVKPVEWIKPGYEAGMDMLDEFIAERLDRYATDRNDPNKFGISNLSPYLHFGQISAQEVALKVQNSGRNQESIDAYIEELVVRRELADNYCYYNDEYDNPKGYPNWAKETLTKHYKDPREFVYSLEEFEKAQTHDELWNASQLEMVKRGKMHGYMRMYWAKKILEWSENVKTAHKTAVYLNDKYELDGRDPNGYVGISWSLGGLHDRPWFDREIFGTVRFMNLNGMKKKFDTNAYIDYVRSL